MIGEVGYLFVRLLAAQIITDFLLQPNTWVESKKEKGWASPYLYIHGGIAGALAYAFSGIWFSPVIPLVVILSHVMIDGLTSTRSGRASVFLLDQAAHISVLLILSFVTVGGGTPFVLPQLVFLISNPVAWIILSGYLVLLWPSSIFIGMFTRKWREDLAGQENDLNEKSLENAGKWIGFFERFLILTFILVQQYTAIGFLVAAKSIFRYSDRRAVGEYILIGTLMSFSISVIVGLLIQSAIGGI